MPDKVRQPKSTAVSLAENPPNQTELSIASVIVEEAGTPVLGLEIDSGAHNAFIRILCLGMLTGTAEYPADTSGFTEGAMLYVSATTAGGLTETKPAFPNQQQNISVVTRAHATLGDIMVMANTPVVQTAYNFLKMRYGD